MAASPQQKVLRICLIQGGKIIEERLMRRRESVTIGQGPKNTIVVPTSNLPPSFTLFENKGGTYALGFSDQMDGRISLTDATAVDFAALKASGQAQPKGQGTYALNLLETSRGKVQLGDVTIIFQFVKPPPEAVKPVLPEAARGGFLAGLDRLFFGLLLGALIFNYSVLFLIMQREVNEDLSIERMPDRFVKMIMPERPPEQPKQEDPGELEKPKEEPKEKAKEPVKEAADTDAAPPKGPTRDELEKTVGKAGLLAMLGSEGDGEGAFQDILSDGADAADVASALDGATRIEGATAENINSALKGGGSGKAATIGDLGTSGAGKAGLGPKRDVVVARVETLGGPDVESSSVDRAAVARFVKGRLKSIQACYEKELKRNPSLRGKVVVRFTIGTSGRVSEVEIEENSLNAGVASCIRATVKFWSFPFKPDEEVPVSYPFVFSPSSG